MTSPAAIGPRDTVATTTATLRITSSVRNKRVNRPAPAKPHKATASTETPRCPTEIGFSTGVARRYRIEPCITPRRPTYRMPTIAIAPSTSIACRARSSVRSLGGSSAVSAGRKHAPTLSSSSWDGGMYSSPGSGSTMMPCTSRATSSAQSVKVSSTAALRQMRVPRTHQPNITASDTPSTSTR